MEVVNYMQKVFKCLNFCSQITLWNKALPKSATSQKYLVQASQDIWYGYGSTPNPLRLAHLATCYLANTIVPCSKESIPRSGWRGCSYGPRHQFGRVAFGNAVLGLGRALVSSSEEQPRSGAVAVPRRCWIRSPLRFLLCPVCFSAVSLPWDPPESTTSQQPPSHFQKLC